MAGVLWSGGRLIREDELTVSAADRTFEHGLGLFETLRTWEGRPALLDRHLARLRASASVLGLAIDPPEPPDAAAVEALRRALGLPADALFRITLSGGPDARLWMRGSPLPTPLAGPRTRLVLGGLGLDPHDPLARHKTLNYWGKRIAHERAVARGADEALLGTPDGRIWEGTRSNLFLIRDGRVATPGPDGPCLPGVMRGVILEIAPEIGLPAEERDILLDDVEAADEVFLTNAVRGVVPVARTPGGRLLAVPGPRTHRLRDHLDRLVRSRLPE